jgi:hypothetical protein
MVLGEVVAEILGAGLPVHNELVLRMSMEQDSHCLSVLLVIPEAVELSVLMAVGGWGLGVTKFGESGT